MPTVNIFPSVVSQNWGGMSSPNNILGFTGNPASYSGALGMYNGVGMTLEMPLKSYIPAGSTINSIVLKTRARCSSSQAMSFYSVALKASNGNMGTYLITYGSGMLTNYSTYTSSFDSWASYMTSAELLGTWDPTIEVNFANLNGNAITISYLDWMYAYLEVAFTPPANTGVMDMSLGYDVAGDATWTNNWWGQGLDTNAATATSTASLLPYYYSNNGSNLPANAIISGVLVDLYMTAGSTANLATVYPKFWGTADGAYSQSIVPYLNCYRFGGMSDTLGRVRGDISGAGVGSQYLSYFRIAPSNGNAVLYSIDHAQCLVYYTLPVATNTSLTLAENF